MKFLYFDLDKNVDKKTGDTIERVESFLKLLSKEEICKADGIKSKKRKMQYIVARGLLRSYLSKKLSKPSSEINISVAKNGAILVHEIYNDSKIFASISHSESKVIVALDNFPLGVDVEYKKERKDFLKLAKYAFNEREEFLKIKNAKTPKMQMELFYKGWTKKEALYKLNSLLENYNFKLDSQKIKFIEKKLFDNYVVMVAR